MGVLESKKKTLRNKENISNRENVVPCLNTIDEIVERKINLFKNIKE